MNRVSPKACESTLQRPGYSEPGGRLVGSRARVGGRTLKDNHMSPDISQRIALLCSFAVASEACVLRIKLDTQVSGKALF